MHNSKQVINCLQQIKKTLHHFLDKNKKKCSFIAKIFVSLKFFQKRLILCDFHFQWNIFLGIQAFVKSTQQCWLFFDKHEITWFEIFERQKTFETLRKLHFQRLQKISKKVDSKFLSNKTFLHCSDIAFFANVNIR